MDIFEAMMLVCFGAAWPISITKSCRSRSSGGKSPVFSVVIILGYICGMIHKVQMGFNWVFYVYLLNTIMVFIDLMLLFRNRALEKTSSKRRKSAQMRPVQG